MKENRKANELNMVISTVTSIVSTSNPITLSKENTHHLPVWYFHHLCSSYPGFIMCLLLETARGLSVPNCLARLFYDYLN